MAETLIVRIADMKWGQGDQQLITYALGSCVGITFYDPQLKLGALLHIQLPSSKLYNDPNPMKYADTGVRETMAALTRQGFCRYRAVVKIAGGARMFGNGDTALGLIGERNVESTKLALAREGLQIAAEDVGGIYARTMTLDLRNGDVKVRSAGKQQIYL